jgi:3-(3-hydroxy-phenyl)propionate hydroxylase
VHYTNMAVTLGHVIKQIATAEEIAEMSQPVPGRVTPWEPPLNAPPVLWAGWLRGPIADDSIIGRMIPQPQVCDTEAMGRLDDRLGSRFVLIGDNTSPLDALTPAQKQAWDALGARYVTIRSQDSYTLPGADEIVDLDGAIQPWMRRYGAKVIALRPDKFVAACDVHGLDVPDFPTEIPADTIPMTRIKLT